MRKPSIFIRRSALIIAVAIVLQGCSKIESKKFSTHENIQSQTEIPTTPTKDPQSEPRPEPAPLEPIVAPVVPSVNCTYSADVTTAVPFGGQISENVSCANLPTGAIVRLVGTKDGAAQFNQIISVTNFLRYNYTTTNNGSASMAGTYLRRVEVRSGVNALLFTTPTVRFVFLIQVVTPPPPPPPPPPQAAIHCSYTILGSVPLDFGGSLIETVNCANLPTFAEVRIVGTKNGSNEINTVIPVLNSVPFAATRTNDMVDKAGTYARKIVVLNSFSQAVLFVSNEMSYVLLPPVAPPPQAAVNCKFRIMESRPEIVFTSKVSEMIYCSNLTARTEVRLVGTKNGIQDVDKVIAVTNPVTNPYSKENYGDFYYTEHQYNDASEKVGAYTRRIVVKDTISQNILFVSSERNYQFMPDLGCVVTITETAPGYVNESANCNYVPPGAVVSLYWPTEDGSYYRHTITLPYSVHRKHNEFELMSGANPKYYYYRDIEVTNESRTIYYAANHFDIFIWKQ